MTKHTKACRKQWVIRTYGFWYCPVHDSIIDWEVEFIDNIETIFRNRGVTCLDCKHYDGKFSCPAFPEVIPQPYLSGMERHIELKYGQINKIIFDSKIKYVIEVRAAQC